MNSPEARAVESRKHQSEGARFPIDSYVERLTRDEIDLIALLETIWQGRLKIALVVFLFVALGTLYSFTATEWFETDFNIAGTKVDELFDINNSELIKITPEKALNEVRKKLNSVENFKDFYLQSTVAQKLLVSPKNISKVQFAYAVFNGQIDEVVKKVKKEDVTSFDLNLEYKFIYPKGVEGSELLSAYLYWSEGAVKRELRDAFNANRDNQLLLNQHEMLKMLSDSERDLEVATIRSAESYKYRRIALQDQLKALKVQLFKKNQQRILVLNENISIAKRLGFKKPTTPSDVKEVKNSKPVSGAGVEIINSEYSGLDKLPMYYRGYESLEAEKLELDKRQKDTYPSSAIIDMEKKLALLERDRDLEKLQNREKPEVFLDGYVALEKRNSYLSALQIKVEGVELFSLNSKPMGGQGSIKPKKIIVLVLSAFAGLMLGCLIVLIQNAVGNRKMSL